MNHPLNLRLDVVTNRIQQMRFSRCGRYTGYTNDKQTLIQILVLFANYLALLIYLTTFGEK